MPTAELRFYEAATAFFQRYRKGENKFIQVTVTDDHWVGKWHKEIINKDFIVKVVPCPSMEYANTRIDTTVHSECIYVKETYQEIYAMLF